MRGFEAFEGFADWHLNANHFHPEKAKQKLRSKPEPDRRLREQFKQVLDERPLTLKPGQT